MTENVMFWSVVNSGQSRRVYSVLGKHLA